MSIVKPHTLPFPSPSPLPFSSSAMNSISSKFRSKLFPSSSPTFRCFFFCSQSLAAETPQKQLTPYSPSTRKTALSRKNLSTRLKAQLKEDWFTSLSCPSTSGDAPRSSNGHPQWVIGVDPDTSGALALLKTDESGCSAQVFDSPNLKVSVGNRILKRLDAKSIVQLLHSLNVPTGTIAYVEQSNPFPIDGKQGWWSGGFGYGLWIGVLVASGISVVPVSSLAWKNKFKLSGHGSIKDVSREFASTLFPSLSPCFKRKKDHGRAEAILIASYGKGTSNVYRGADTLNQ